MLATVLQRYTLAIESKRPVMPVGRLTIRQAMLRCSSSSAITVTRKADQTRRSVGRMAVHGTALCAAPVTDSGVSRHFSIANHRTRFAL